MYIYLNINNVIISQVELRDFTLDILGYILLINPDY